MYSSNSLNNVILSTGSIGTTTGTTLTVNPSGQLTTLAGQQLQIATTGSTGLSGLPQTVMLTQTTAPQQATQATVVAQKAVAGIQQPQPMVVQSAPGGITTVHKVYIVTILHTTMFYSRQNTYIEFVLILCLSKRLSVSEMWLSGTVQEPTNAT